MPNWVRTMVDVSAPTKEDLIHFFNEVKDSHGGLDFNKIIPMPKGIAETMDLRLVFGDVDAYAAIGEYLVTKKYKMMNKHKYSNSVSEFLTHDKQISPKTCHTKRKMMLTAEQVMDEKEKKVAVLYYKNLKETGYTNWYDWQYENWNTKWGACDCYELEEKDIKCLKEDKKPYTINFAFNTAWGFAEPIFHAMAKKYPTLAFVVQFADEDFGNNTRAGKWENGECVYMEYLPHGYASYQNAAEVWNDFDPLDYWDENQQDIDWDAYHEQTGW